MTSEQNLTSVFTDTADAIREKTGKTDKIKPINFADEIKSINSDNTLLNSLIDRSITEISNDEVTSVGGNAFKDCSLLSVISFNNANTLKNSSFQNCSALASATFPNVLYVWDYCFFNSGIQRISFNLLTLIQNNAFQNCLKLNTFIVRTTSLCVLNYTNAFANTPIATSTTEGFIYVPDDLVESYRDATNWTTYKTKIMPIRFVDGNYQEIDLGTLNWTYVGGSYTAYSSGLQSTIKTPANYSKMCNLMCEKYQTLPEQNLTSTDKSIALTSSGLILINDSSLGTSAATVKTALSGVKLKYLLKGE